MRLKKTWIYVSVAVVVTSAIIYWFNFSKPTPFPNNKQLIEEINKAFPAANPSVIQETITLGKRHVFVPFISSKDDYGLSFWVWQRNQWQLASINTKGRPTLWKIDRKNPSTFYFVWNINPEDRLSSIDFYLIRDRRYGVTEGIERYDPKVQLANRVSVQEKSYGAEPLPEDWVTFIESSNQVESAKQPNWFFDHNFANRTMYFGWIPFGRDNKETFPERSINGNGFSRSGIETETPMKLNQIDLEWDGGTGP